MSPLLFVLVAFLLSSMWERAEATTLISSFSLSSQGRQITRLHYADDITLLWLVWGQIFVAKLMLEFLAEVSGLRVNFHKSQLICISMDNWVSKGIYNHGLLDWRVPYYISGLSPYFGGSLMQGAVEGCIEV